MKILRVFFLGILALVGLVAGALGWVLFTQSGRDFAVGQVNDYTATLATPVVLGKLEGNVLRDARLSSLTVADGGGVWVEIQGIRVVWHPLALLDGTAPFERMEAAKIEVVRLPVVVSETVVVEEKSGGNPLDYLVYVPREIALEDVIVGAAVTGQRHRLRALVEGVGGVKGVSISTLEGPLTTVSGTVAVEDLDAGRVNLEMHEGPRGLVGGLLKLPVTAEITGKIVGSLRGANVSLSLVDVRAGQTRISGLGEGVRDGSLVSGTVRIESGDLTELQGLLGAPVRGKVQADVAVSGSLAGFGVSLQVTNTDIAVSDTRAAAVGAAMGGRIDVRNLESLPFTLKGLVSGRLSGVGTGVYPLTIEVAGGGTRAAMGGEVSVTMVRKNERASVRVVGAGTVSPLTVSGTIAGNWVQGKNTFALRGGVDVDAVRARLSGLTVTGPGTVVSASGVVDMESYLVDGRGVVKVADLRPLAALGGVVATGGLDGEVVAQSKGGIQVGDATVRTFEISYEAYKAVLKQPARLVWDGRTGSLSPFELAIAGGTVTAQGRMNAQMVAADLTVTNVDVTQVADTDVVEGKVNVAAKVSGRPEKPVVVMAGDFAGVTGEYPVEVKVTGDWRNGVLKVGAVGTSREASATADVTAGGGLSLMPFTVGIGTESALRGTVALRIPLEILNPSLWASRQQVGGVVSGNATLGGTLGAPEANGRFVLADGSYTQSTSGVCLKNVGAEIVASRDVITVNNLVSTDGLGGRLTGSARVGLQGVQPIDAKVGLDKLQLFCGGLAVGTVDGSIGIDGRVADHTVRGAVTVGPLNVQVPGANNDADIPQVEYVRVSDKALVSGPGMMTRLAVTVDAPQRVYVRGRGIDAEFGGKIEVGGTANAPLLTGNLKALRGHYTLLDRTLDLADTNIRFEGPIPPSPYLDVKATTRAQGTQITVAITGSASKPQIVLTSEPSLPQDEVLALLLFGRKLANVSAFEAIKLAQATRVLAGLDGGEPTILDKARKTLGVDTLDIGSGEDSGDVTVTTGKYLTDDVYLSIQQGAEPEDRLIKTEVELTRSVTGNTTIDGAGSQAIGVEWKRDY